MMLPSGIIMISVAFSVLYCTVGIYAAYPAVIARQEVELSPAIPRTAFGMVLPVHRPNPNTGAVCGQISEQDVMKIEAFFWAMRTYNIRSDRNLGTPNLPSIVYDSCGSADRIYEHLEAVTEHKNITKTRILSYIVSDKSAVTLRTSKLLSRENTIVVSAALNNVALDTSTSYYLTPSAKQEARAIVDVLDSQNWEYVQVLYVDDEYGKAAVAAFTSFIETVGDRRITITNQRSISVLPGTNTPDLGTQPYVVVVFAYAEQKEKIRKDLSEKRFVILTTNVADDYGGQYTGDNSYTTDTLELRTEPTAKYQSAVQKFNKYIEDLTWQNARYKWFDEYWQSKHLCTIQGNIDTQFNASCSTSIKLGKSVKISESSTALIIQSVDMMMDALLLGCPVVCPTNTFENHKSTFNERFRNQFVEESQVFDGGLLGPASVEYKVDLIQWNPVDGNFQSAEVGTVGATSISLERVAPVYRGRLSYQSVGAIIHRSVRHEDEYGIRNYLWWIAIVVLASIGILLVLIIAILLAILLSRKAMISYVWLYAILLFGAFLGYLTLYAYIFVPTTATCGITRFGVGFSYAVCFSVMVVLALLLCKKTEMFPTAAVSTIFIAVSLVLLVAIELVILIIWLIWTPPGVSYVIYRGTSNPIWICNHYTLSDSGWFDRTVFENHLLHLIYVMLLILVVLILAIFIFMRRKYLSTSRDKMESYALLAAGIGTGIGTVAIWLVWTLVGAYGVSIHDVHNYGDAAMAFGLWFTLTWLLLFLLVQIIYVWRSARSKLHKTLHENKLNLAHVQAVNGGVVVGTTSVDGNLNNHHTSKEVLVSQANGETAVTTSYEQHVVETKVDQQNMGYQSSQVSEQPLRIVGNDHQHVYKTGSIYCAECGFEHDPHALRLVHPRSEHTSSVHDSSLDYTTAGRLGDGMAHTDGRVHSNWEIQALHMKHARNAPVVRSGSLDMSGAGPRHMVYGGNSRYARSEIGGTHGTNIVDLRRHRHGGDKVRYIPSNQNTNVYFTEGNKGTSVI